MIDIQTLEVSGFKGSILGMRNPFKNREKSDSGFKSLFSGNYEDETGKALDPNFVNKHTVYRFAPVLIGPKDMELCQKLVRAGGDDDAKFMRMIHVQADVNAPLYWWKEYDTYKVATVANSESTMHTIHKREFTSEDFSTDYFDTRFYQIDIDDDQNLLVSPYEQLYKIIRLLNAMRKMYLNAVETKDPDAKKIWYQMIQLLPESYMQKRTIDLNYQTLRRIYFARRNHKLNEWRWFCDWIKDLPYAEELITYKPDEA